MRSEPTLLRATTPPVVDCVRIDDIFLKISVRKENTSACNNRSLAVHALLRERQACTRQQHRGVRLDSFLPPSLSLSLSFDLSGYVANRSKSGIEIDLPGGSYESYRRERASDQRRVARPFPVSVQRSTSGSNFTAACRCHRSTINRRWIPMIGPAHAANQTALSYT